MKLLGTTKSKIIKDTNCENIRYLEITELVSVYCNIGNNDYQQDSRALHTVVSNKSFGKLLDISFKKIIFLKSLFKRFIY